jgi:hypothetical protein
MKETIYVNVKRCARCGKDHDHIEFAKFDEPVKDSDGTKWNYWATCLNTGDPILMRVEEE